MGFADADLAARIHPGDVAVEAEAIERFRQKFELLDILRLHALGLGRADILETVELDGLVGAEIGRKLAARNELDRGHDVIVEGLVEQADGCDAAIRQIIFAGQIEILRRRRLHGRIAFRHHQIGHVDRTRRGDLVEARPRDAGGERGAHLEVVGYVIFQVHVGKEIRVALRVHARPNELVVSVHRIGRVGRVRILDAKPRQRVERAETGAVLDISRIDVFPVMLVGRGIDDLPADREGRQLFEIGHRADSVGLVVIDLIGPAKIRKYRIVGEQNRVRRDRAADARPHAGAEFQLAVIAFDR